MQSLNADLETAIVTASRDQLCGHCAKLSVVCKCRECEKELCKSCCTALHTTAVLHTVVDTVSQLRLCQLHDWEKLTVYSIKSKSFGCIRCFQEGPLKGNQGLSLQVSKYWWLLLLANNHSYLSASRCGGSRAVATTSSFDTERWTFFEERAEAKCRKHDSRWGRVPSKFYQLGL